MRLGVDLVRVERRFGARLKQSFGIIFDWKGSKKMIEGSCFDIGLVR
jgi:hypothetical protein